MSSLNKAMIIGRLGQDPEVRFTQSNTAVANFSVATSSRYKNAAGELIEETEWHRIVAWGRTAEIVQEYLKKGSQVYIEGPIQTRKWEDKEGVTRYSTEIKALTMTMLGGKGDNAGGGQRPTPPTGDTPVNGSNTEVSGVDKIDDDLPF